MITDNIDVLNIKIIGSWNPKIFHPLWLVRNLSFKDYPLVKQHINFLFNFEEIEIGYEFNGIKILPREKLLTIIINKEAGLTEEKITYATNIMLKILSLLPHTPIKALGFNICYKFQKDTNNKLIQSLIKDDNNINGFQIGQNNYVLKKEDYKINLIFSYLEDGYSIEFSFHYDKLRAIDENIYLKHIKEAEGFVYNG
jgi:hypothetical protein